MVAAALSLPLRVPKAALYGTHAPLGFGLPNMLSRFRLRQVRGLLLALNSRNALTRETTWSLWSVPSVCALALSDSSSLDATLAEYSLSVVCATALGDAPVCCECGPAPLDGPVDVVTDGSSNGDRLGWSPVVVSSLGVIAEASSRCAMVGASLWVAEQCGKALILWLQSVLVVPFGEYGGGASRCPWVDALRLC